MMKRQWMWLAAALAMLMGTGSAFAQTQASTPQAPTTSTASTPSAATPSAATAPATVVTDSVNVPVQVRTALRGIPVVNTQQILHKSSLDPEDAAASETTGAVRLLNNLDLNSVGVRMDLTATSRATTPGAAGTASSKTTPSNSNSSLASASTAAKQASAKQASAKSGSGTTQTQTLTLDASKALAHAALEGTAETVVRLGPTNAEIVSVSGRGLASVAEVTGTCGSLESASQVSLGTTNLRILGREIALPENPEPNTEVALADIPGLVSGTVILNEQATFGDGATSKIIAVAPLRLLLRLSLAGLGGLADVEVSLAGNSASVDCAPDSEEPAPEPPTTPTTPSTPETPTTPTTPSTPSTPATPTTPPSV